MARLTGFMVTTSDELVQLDEKGKLSDNLQGNFKNLLDRFKDAIARSIQDHARNDIPYGKVFDEFDVVFEGELAGIPTAFIEVKFEWYGEDFSEDDPDNEAILKFDGNHIVRTYRDFLGSSMDIPDFFEDRTKQMLSDFAHNVREEQGL